MLVDIFCVFQQRSKPWRNNLDCQLGCDSRRTSRTWLLRDDRRGTGGKIRTSVKKKKPKTTFITDKDFSKWVSFERLRKVIRLFWFNNNKLLNSCSKLKILTIKPSSLKNKLRACLHGGGGPQVDEVTNLGGAPASPLLVISRRYDGRVFRSAGYGNPVNRGHNFPCKRLKVM